MSNIAITSLVQSVPSDNGTVFKDLHLDLQFGTPAGKTYWPSYTSDDAVADYDTNAVMNSIFNILNTTQGEKILDPLFGANLQQYLFMPVNSDNGGLIGNAILKCIQSYEPRVNVNSVNVYTDIANVEYQIIISVTIPALQNASAQLNGTLSSSGFTLN